MVRDRDHGRRGRGLAGGAGRDPPRRPANGASRAAGPPSGSTSRRDRSPGTIVGEAEVEGQPEELSAKLAGLLAREGIGPFGPIKIVVRDRHEVAFEPAGPSMLGFRCGRIRLAPTGSRTRIDYAIETSPRGLPDRRLGGPGPRPGGADRRPDPGVRSRPAQPEPEHPGPVRSRSIQMVHFLWPPFLFAHLARQPARMFRGQDGVADPQPPLLPDRCEPP